MTPVVVEAMSQELIIIGKPIRTHGLRGALRVELLTDAPNRFQKLKQVILETPSGIQKICTLISAQGDKLQVILSCQEITSIEEAKLFVRGWVKIPRSESSSLVEGQYYRFDLIGMAVFFEDGRFLGNIEEILETRGNDIFVIRNKSKEWLVPAIQQIVRQVDIERKRMTLSKIEGLIEYDAV